MIEAAVSASRGPQADVSRRWARGSTVSTGVKDHEESSASPSMQSCTAIWRRVSRSMATMALPQGGHGGKDTRVDVSSTAAAGTGGGLISSACRQRDNASVRQRGARNRRSGSGRSLSAARGGRSAGEIPPR